MIDKVSALVNTSADDCRISLLYVTDLDVLGRALDQCREFNKKTHTRHIASRIRRLEKQ
jgi:hypothetical protein